jgi:hypothetical protein
MKNNYNPIFFSFHLLLISRIINLYVRVFLILKETKMQKKLL